MTDDPKPKKTKKTKTLALEVPEPQTGERSRDQDRFALKRKIRYFYDLQRLRLQVGGRLAKRPEGVTIDLHAYDVELLKLRATELEKVEKEALKDVAAHLKTMPFYVKVLSDKERFRGIGPTMAGVILSEFDIYREEYPSQMWSFSGLAPVAAKRCKSCHAVVVDGKHQAARASKPGDAPEPEAPKKTKCTATETYDSGKAMRPTKGEKLPYNAFLKTKLVGVLGGVLLKLNSPWRKFYDDYKHRKTSAGWGVSDGHRHNAAIRYMIKMLLLEIWTQWRRFEKLPMRGSYQEQYLGHKHHGNDENQHESVSQEEGEAQKQRASQDSNDTQAQDASHTPDETQRGYASRSPNENHAANASRNANGTHDADASRRIDGAQDADASQSSYGNHIRDASHGKYATHQPNASHSESGAHSNHADLAAEIEAEIQNL